MDQRIKVANTRRWRFSNALHSIFQSKMHQLVTSGFVPTATLLIDEEMLREWKEQIDIEIDCNRNVRGTALTKLLEGSDKLRIKHVSYLFDAIRTASKSPDANVAGYANYLIPLVKGYLGLQAESREDRTAHIHGLVADLAKPEFSPHVQALGLQGTVANLSETNAGYEQLSDTRTSRANAINNLCRRTRAVTDELFNRVCAIIEVAYLISKCPEDKAAMEHLVNEMNKHIDRYRTAHNQRVAQKKGAGSGVGTSGQGHQPAPGTTGTTPATNDTQGSDPATHSGEEGESNGNTGQTHPSEDGTPGESTDTPAPSEDNGNTPTDSGTGSDGGNGSGDDWGGFGG